MKLVDAHIHLPNAEYAKFTEELVTEANEPNVVALVSNSMVSGNKHRQPETG